MITYIHAKELRKQGRRIPCPFELHLKKSPHGLIINEILRILPNRRLTALASWKGEEVIVKMFFDENPKYFQRELDGVGRLSTIAAPTAKLLGKDADRSGTISILIYDYIKDANPLSVLWQQFSEEDKSHCNKKIMTILSQLHQQGMLHDDLHLDNFLVKQWEIYLLDAESVRQINPNGPLDKKTSLKNIAQYFSQFSSTNDKTIMLSDYYQSRGWGQPFAEQFEKIMKITRHKRLKKYAKKTLRNCTEFFCKKTFLSRQLWLRQWAPLKEDIDGVVTQGNLIKDGNTCTVVKATVADNHWVIKRYNIKNIAHGLSRFLRKKRAENSWKFSQLFQLLGIKTATPVALLENKIGPFKGRSYFVSQLISGSTLDHYLLSSGVLCHDMMGKTMDLLYELYANQMSHGDLKASNVMIGDNDAYLIDLDSVKLHRSKRTLDRAWKKDISRFLCNWEHFPEIKQFFTHGLKVRGLLL